MTRPPRPCEYCARTFTPGAEVGRLPRFCGSRCSGAARRRRRTLAAAGLSENHASVLALLERGDSPAAIAKTLQLAVCQVRCLTQQAMSQFGSDDREALLAAARGAKVLPHPRLSLAEPDARRSA